MSIRVVAIAFAVTFASILPVMPAQAFTIFGDYQPSTNTFDLPRNLADDVFSSQRLAGGVQRTPVVAPTVQRGAMLFGIDLTAFAKTVQGGRAGIELHDLPALDDLDFEDLVPRAQPRGGNPTSLLLHAGPVIDAER